MAARHSWRLALPALLALSLPGLCGARELMLLDQRLALDFAAAQVAQATAQPDLSVPAPTPAKSAVDDELLRRLRSGRRLRAAGLWTLGGGVVAFIGGSAVVVSAALKEWAGQRSPRAWVVDAGAVFELAGLVAIPVGIVILSAGNERTYQAAGDWSSAHPGVPVPP